ncbi:MAG: hypothetical protein E7414_03105 [Ruminococcaceae bacterium]|nr:hypothetical protein [Oscillospiraceae bacterium]
MKKGLIKILAATTATAMLLSMSVSAMAATYFTTTTYGTPGADGTEYVDVATTVYGLAAGEEVAYLVYKESDPATSGIQDSEIVYIDQKAFNEASTGAGITFDFTTEVANAEGVGSAVRLGSAGTAWSTTNFTAHESKEVDVKIGEYTVTYSGTNCYVIADEGELIDTKDEEATVTDFAGKAITFYVLPATGYTIADATVKVGDSEAAAANLVAVAEKGYATYTYIATADANLTFACTEKVADATVTPTTGGVTYVEAANQLTKTLTVTGTAANAAECGIIFSNDQTKLENINTKEALDNRGEQTYVRKLPALGVGSGGEFTIEVIDTRAAADASYAEAADTLYVRTYAIDASGDATFSATTTIGKTPAAQ